MRGKLAMLMLCALRPGITPADAGKTCKLWRKPLLCRDHPRGCGENTVLRRQASRVRGSPPRMRGKLHGPRRHGENRGITPADAGKTHAVRPPSSPSWDHPRGCGENLPPVLLLMPQAGSPPRMRGKPSREEVTFFLPRITPAGAGKTVSR